MIFIDDLISEIQISQIYLIKSKDILERVSEQDAFSQLLRVQTNLKWAKRHIENMLENIENIENQEEK